MVIAKREACTGSGGTGGSVVWRWMTSLSALAVCVYYFPDVLLNYERTEQRTWLDLHRIVGEAAILSSLIWLVLLAIACRRLGRKALWALLALPLVLFWDVMWVVANFTATFQ
jgi:hypothetical protein